jgi:uncharacterized membrane protein
VSAAGFVTGLYVVLTPVMGLALFRMRVGRSVWAGVALATAGLALLSGVEAGSPLGDLLVLGGAAAYSLQIVLMERYAPRYDPLALTLVEMVAACAGFLAIALARGDLGVPRGWTVWGALVVTGVFASALAFLVQTWAQQRTSATRTAVVFALEPMFAALFGYTLAGDRLGWLGWAGCAVIMCGIVVAEPAAADVLRRIVRRPGGVDARAAGTGAAMSEKEWDEDAGGRGPGADVGDDQDVPEDPLLERPRGGEPGTTQLPDPSESSDRFETDRD